jgi:hypothetical protein
MQDIFNKYINEENYNAKIDDNIIIFDKNIFFSQAIEDLNSLENILISSYSGNDYLEKQGFHISEKLKIVKDKFTGNGKINKVDFFDLICDALKEIKDYHLVFNLLYFNKAFAFCEHNTLYFADIVIERQNSDYIICESGYKEIEIGSIIYPQKENLRPTFNNKFLYGVFSETSISNININLKYKDVTVTVRSLPIKNNIKNIWEKQNVFDTDIVKINRFRTSNEQEKAEMQEFIAYGKKLRNSKRLIIDLRGNGGGDSQNARNFIENLNGTAIFDLNYAKLDTQASRLAEISFFDEYNDENEYNDKRREILKDSSAFWSCMPKQEKTKGTFEGELYILTDRGTGSSGEIMIKCLKDNIPQTIIVGENTCGILNTGDSREFILPHSLMLLSIPTAIFADIFIEGTGFLPDIWVNGDALDALLHHIK